MVQLQIRSNSTDSAINSERYIENMVDAYSLEVEADGENGEEKTYCFKREKH